MAAVVVVVVGIAAVAAVVSSPRRSLPVLVSLRSWCRSWPLLEWMRAPNHHHKTTRKPTDPSHLPLGWPGSAVIQWLGKLRSAGPARRLAAGHGSLRDQVGASACGSVFKDAPPLIPRRCYESRIPLARYKASELRHKLIGGLGGEKVRGQAIAPRSEIAHVTARSERSSYIVSIRAMMRYAAETTGHRLGTSCRSLATDLKESCRRKVLLVWKAVPNTT